MWEVEEIPDIDYVLVRVHIQNFIDKNDNRPKASAFLNTPKDGDNLSCDWCKYATVDSSKKLISLQIKKDGTFKNSDEFKMWKFFVNDLKTQVSPSQNVKHDPIYNDPAINGAPNNRAHSIIIGEKQNNAEFRLSLINSGSWAE